MYIVEKGEFIIIKGKLLEECTRIGTARYETNRANNVKEQIYAKRDPLEISIQGVIVEMATSIMFKFAVCDIKNTRVNSVYTDRGDMLLEGKRIDIKGPYGHDKPLMIREHSLKNPSDIYILSTIEKYKDAWKVIFQGSIPLHLLKKDKHKKFIFNQNFYEIQQSELLRLDESLEL